MKEYHYARLALSASYRHRCIIPLPWSLFGEEVIYMSDEKKPLSPPGKELEEASKNFLDKWTKRYAHTKFGKFLGFLGFGK